MSNDSNIQDLSDLYNEYSPDAAQTTLNNLPSGTDYFKTEVVNKVYTIRVLPPERGAGRVEPYRVVSRHFMQLPGFGALSFNCPRLMTPKDEAPRRCPGCEKAAQLAATGNPADVKLAKAIGAGMRAYAKVIDREHPEKGVQVFEFGVTVLKRLIGFRDPAQGINEDFTHPINGCDLLVKKLKDSPWYTVDLARNRGRLAERDEQIREWLIASNEMPLEKYARVLTYGEIISLIMSKQGQGQGQGKVAGDVSAGAVGDGRTAQDAIDAEVVYADELPF
jgi:hypothetical protein